MDLTKKRKLDENGTVETDFSLSLTPQDIRKIIEPFTHDQLLEIIQNAAHSHPDVLDAVRSLADADLAQRKLFVRGLGWETTNESLRSIFASYGELEEAAVIVDKNTNKSKGYGFVTYKHIDGAVLALKEPSKTIDGRVAVAQLASAGVGATGGGVISSADVSLRKIYVGNVPYDMPSGKLLSHFIEFGEVEEGPLGFDKATGKSKGFALFVYKTPEGAQAALANPMKVIEGRQLLCKLASEGKKGKPMGGPGGGLGAGHGPEAPMQSYAGPPGGFQGYPGHGGPGMGHHQNPNPGYGSGGYQGGQGQGGGGGGYGGGYGGSHYAGPAGSGGYGGPSGAPGGGYGGGNGAPGGGYGGGAGGAGRGYGMPPPAGGGYDGGHYGGSGYPGPQHQPSQTSPAPRGGPGGMYPNAPPPYY